MKDKLKIHNLSIPGIDQTLFSNPFYSGNCEKINFNGVIKEYKIQSDAGTDFISLAPKFIPHSDHELMLQSTDSLRKSSITSLTDEALHHIFGIGFEFIKFLSDPKVLEKYGMTNGYPYLVYNYDEFTTDRHSGMSKKDFHLHLNSWTSDTLKNVTQIDREKVSTFYYRSVVDPIFDITQTLARDALECEELRKYLTPANPICDDQSISYSSVYEVAGGWKSLQDKDFPSILKTVHKRLEDRYIEILRCFCGVSTIPELYTRHPLLSKKEIRSNISSSNFQDMTKIALADLIDKLTTITPERFQEISKNKNLRDTLIVLRWLAYSVGFFSNSYIDENMSHEKQPLFINVTPRLFTKIGGASIMNFPDHALVKIDRGQGNISREEFNKRLEFHKEFTRQLR